MHHQSKTGGVGQCMRHRILTSGISYYAKSTLIGLKSVTFKTEWVVSVHFRAPGQERDLMSCLVECTAELLILHFKVNYSRIRLLLCSQSSQNTPTSSGLANQNSQLDQPSLICLARDASTGNEVARGLHAKIKTEQLELRLKKVNCEGLMIVNT